MRILYNEITKILNWRMLVLLALVNFILYFLFTSFYITHFPNGRPLLDSYRISVEMIEKYGTEMDEAELQDFKRTYETQVEEANQYLQSREEFVKAGLATYEQFKNLDYDNAEQVTLYDEVLFEKELDLFWELQERERLIEFHNAKETILLDELNHSNSAQQAHLEQMMAAGKYQLYPSVAFDNYKSFIRNVAIAIIVSVALVISPIFIKDRSIQMLDIQYTTKQGRNLYVKKIMAGLISTFVVITALLIVYFSFYATNNTGMYFPVPIHMFIGSSYSWYDPTFLQFIGLTVAAIYVIGFVIVLLAMGLSSIMPNYVSLIGIQVPIIIGVVIYGLSILLGRMMSMDMPQWMIPAVYSVLAAASMIFIWMTWRLEKRRDIVV